MSRDYSQDVDVVRPVWRTIRQWFDPSDVRTVGTTPDYRFSLANERTFLAWIRTGLALVGGGLAVAGFLPPLRLTHLREAIALVLILLGAAIGVRAVDHWARSERAMRLGIPLPQSRFPALLGLALGLGGLLLAGAVLAGVR
jgi:putative membrane protein